MGLTAHNLRRHERERANQPVRPPAPQTTEEIQRLQIAQLEEQLAAARKTGGSESVEQLEAKVRDLTSERDSLRDQLAATNAQLEELMAEVTEPGPKPEEPTQKRSSKRRG